MRLSARAERALLQALLREWHRINVTRLDGALMPPTLELSDTVRRIGGWQRDTRTLSVSRALCIEQPWPVVREVLLHEVVHQYVHEVLEVHDETPHGPAFRDVCHRVGADPRAAGLPVTDEAEPTVMRRVRKLLALADSTNVHEAEAAARAAHKLMRRHNIDHAGEEAAFGIRALGRAQLRHMTHERLLSGLLGAHFFVRPVWVRAYLPERQRWGKVIEISGRPENLDLAEHVWHFVIDAAERLWEAHRAATDAKGRARGRYLAGVVTGFWEQLEAEARACEETGLVWVGDGALEDFVERRFANLQKGRRTSIRTDRHWASGRAAGQSLRLRRPVGEEAGNRGRVLERRDD